jgi:GNAT superfamily N-acetyltransferase
VARVFGACWHGPYAAFLPPPLAARYDEVASSGLWRARFEPAPDPGLLVAELDDAVVGVALVLPETAYLASLYVDPAVHGRGIGRLLFARAVSACRSAGADRMTWWVFAENAAGRTFYGRLGAEPTGRTRVQVEFGLTETEYALDLVT